MDVDKLAKILEGLEPHLEDPLEGPLEGKRVDMSEVVESEEEAEGLLTLADALTQLAPPDLTPGIEDRIFAKFEAKMAQEPAASVVQARKLRDVSPDIAAIMPRRLVQRRADQLAAMIDAAAQGQTPDAMPHATLDATGQMAAMVAAASALKPLPQIVPSPSFVDWLEVRLAQAGREAVPEKAGILDSIGQIFQSPKFQAGLAGAAAVLALVGGIGLQGHNAPPNAPAPGVDALKAPSQSSAANLPPAAPQVAESAPAIVAAAAPVTPATKVSSDRTKAGSANPTPSPTQTSPPASPPDEGSGSATAAGAAGKSTIDRVSDVVFPGGRS